jgi:hypothetical protein
VCVSIAVEACLPSRSLVTAVSSGSMILALSGHVTVCLNMLIYVGRGYSVTIVIGIETEYFLARVS